MELNNLYELIVVVKAKEQIVDLNHTINSLLENENIPIAIIRDKNNSFFKMMDRSKSDNIKEIEYVIIAINYLKTFEA